MKISTLVAAVWTLFVSTLDAEDLRDFSLNVSKTFGRGYKLTTKTDGRSVFLRTQVWSPPGYSPGTHEIDRKKQLQQQEIGKLTDLLANVDLATLKAAKKPMGLDGETWLLSFGAAEAARASFWSPSKKDKELLPLVALGEYLRELADID